MHAKYNANTLPDEPMPQREPIIPAEWKGLESAVATLEGQATHALELARGLRALYELASRLSGATVKYQLQKLVGEGVVRLVTPGRPQHPAQYGNGK